MKKRSLFYLIPIGLCLLVLFLYQQFDALLSDTTAPIIQMDGELLVSVKDGDKALLQGVTANDDRDGDVSQSLIVESVIMLDSSHLVKVTYAAFDKAGNVSKASRQVRFTDYESPRFRLSAPLLFQESNAFNLLRYISAEDALDGDISRWIRASSLSGTAINTPGTHDVEFRVTNSLGDTVKLTMPVRIYAENIYQGHLELTDYLVYLPEGSSFDAESYLQKYTLALQSFPLDAGIPEHCSLKLTGQVDTQTPGVYVVGYELSYSPGNSNYTGYSQLIVVVEDAL